MAGSRPRLGALVVGQSPRPEVEALVADLSAGAVDLDLRGALDGFSRAEIDRMRPGNDADALFTRLPDGSGVTIGKRHVIAHGTRQLRSLADSGSDVVLVMCTGAFPDWMARFRAVFPSRTLESAVAACQPEGRLGVLVPLAEQGAQAHARWGARGYAVSVRTLSPNAAEADARAAAADLAAAGADLLVLDCMSYTRETKRAMRAEAGVPAILAVSSAVRMALELVD